MVDYYEELVKLALHASNVAVPGLGTAVGVGIGIYRAVEQVKVYHRQCRHLADRCATLLLALRDSIEGLEGTKMAALSDEVSGTVSMVFDRVTAWGNLNFLQSIVQNSQINEGIANFHRKIDTCIGMFHVNASIELYRGQRDIRLIQKQMADEFRLHLEKVVTEMYATLFTFTRPRETAESIMSSLQMQLRNPDLDANQQEIFQNALQKLRQDISNLPLLSNHGETSDDPVSHGPVHEIQPVTNSQESPATTGSRPIPSRLTVPPKRPSTSESSSSSSSRSSFWSVFSRKPRSETGTVYSPVSPISSTSPTIKLPQTEELNSQVEDVVPNSRSRHRSHLSNSSSTPPQVDLPPIDPGNLESDIRETLTSTKGGDRSSRPAPGPNVELPDFTLLVREDRSGKVMAGTVEGLIGRLISDSQDFRKKMAYRGTFFISYVGFTTSDTIFKFLAQSLREAANFDGSRRGTILYNVTAVMKDWLASPHVQVEMDVLLQMQNFAHSFGTTPRMVDFANYVTEKINMSNVFQDHTPQPPSREMVIPRRCPCSLANALTILEGKIYDRLLPGDYIVHFMDPSTEGNIASARKIHKAINNWVQKSILIPENYEVRAGKLEFFVNTAIECHKICNFASTAAIVNALRSPSIKCLCTTISAVRNPRLLKTLSDLEELIKSRPRYNKALEKSKGECIPWIDAHLAQLKSIFDKHPQTIEHEGYTLINFKRYQAFSSEMGKITHCKAPNFTHDPETTSWLIYLEDQLRTVQQDNGIEHSIGRRSQELEVEEKRLLQQRVPQLKAAGFRVQ